MLQQAVYPEPTGGSAVDGEHSRLDLAVVDVLLQVGPYDVRQLTFDIGILNDRLEQTDILRRGRIIGLAE